VSASEPLISCRNIAKIYQLGEQEVAALKDVSFDIDAGEFIAIMGPSGSGKSTLMNLVGALDVPTSGSLIISGSDIGTLDDDELARLRNEVIGFVFQQFNLLARTTALENVKLPLLYARRRPDDPDAAARHSLERVGLADRIDHLSTQLSGGQQQRVAIARALVNDPRVILADEPTGALDTETSSEIMTLLRELNERGTTVIVVTHEPEVAVHARRVIRLRDGLIEEDTVTAAVTGGGGL